MGAIMENYAPFSFSLLSICEVKQTTENNKQCRFCKTPTKFDR